MKSETLFQQPISVFPTEKEINFDLKVAGKRTSHEDNKKEESISKGTGRWTKTEHEKFVEGNCSIKTRIEVIWKELEVSGKACWNTIWSSG